MLFGLDLVDDFLFVSVGFLASYLYIRFCLCYKSETRLFYISIINDVLPFLSPISIYQVQARENRLRAMGLSLGNK